MDPLKHKMYTGTDNSVILNNFAKLAKEFPELQPRMPIIPVIDDGEENILSVIEFLKDNKMESIHCLPYHNLGEAKHSRINSSMKSLELQNINSNYIERVRKKRFLHHLKNFPNLMRLLYINYFICIKFKLIPV